MKVPPPVSAIELISSTVAAAAGALSPVLPAVPVPATVLIVGAGPRAAAGAATHSAATIASGRRARERNVNPYLIQASPKRGFRGKPRSRQRRTIAAGMSDTGLFGPDSVTWRVNREGALLLGGGRALLLQVAHPLVAAGVSQHSNYREDPFGRLYRTLDTVTAIVFGSTPTAKEAAARLHRVHTRVKGEAGDGTPYVATDPALIMWVHATLVDTSLLVYERYIGHLPDEERE